MAAVVRFLRRRDRVEHPNGCADRAGRWYPDASEGRVVAREPSRRFPWTMMHACRTLKHCAQLEAADSEKARAMSFRARRAVNACLAQGRPYAEALVAAFPEVAVAAAAAWLTERVRPTTTENDSVAAKPVQVS